MGNIFPNIKPGGLSQKDKIDWLYMALYSLQGLCQKLDADSAVSGTTYEANCVTALFNVVIENSAGSHLNLAATASSSLQPTIVLSPTGDDAGVADVIFNLLNALETLTEQLDADGGVADTDYEANCFTATMPYTAENRFGTTVGNGSAFCFRAAAGVPEKEFVDFCYDWMNSWETLAEQLDSDGTVNDTNYEALWYTATFTLMVEDSTGSRLGVSR